MPTNTVGAVDVPLSLFGGLDTETSPNDLPEGISPSCSDVIFLPGSVQSRPGLHHALNTPLPNGATVEYINTYLQPNGDPLTIILDSNGIFWKEDVLNSPGTYSQIGSTIAGSKALSVSAFGREYIAISDGRYGADVPRQYDGTYFDRVSQDGPALSPTVTNYAPPPATLMGSGSGSPVSITSITPIDETTIYIPDPVRGGPPGHSITVWLSLEVLCASTTGLAAGTPVTITGNTLYNGTQTIASVIDGTRFTTIFGSGSPTVGTGGSFTTISPSLIRQSNVVTAYTSAPHDFQAGYQVTISSVTPSPLGGGITSAVIDNEVNPGIATITTADPHGLVPNSQVYVNVDNVVVGGTISAISEADNIVSVTTSAAHGLSAGAEVTISGVTDGSYDGTYFVIQIITPYQFTYESSATSGSPSSGGTVTYIWALNVNATDTSDYAQPIVTVQTVPTPTTFTISINYSDGTWTSGSVLDIWNGTFFIASVPTETSFTYQNIGPNDFTDSSGTVTADGQASPGQHQCVLMFETRQGYITAPSPPLTFTVNGGQYLLFSNIAIGPSNVTKRIIGMTGAGGDNFFTILTTPQVNGLPIGTSLVINDNTTTSILLDVSDNSLFAATGIDIPGNDLFSQVVLGPCLGVAEYADRMFWWGERNKVQNLLNMGFEGGTLSTAPNVPLGWTITGSNGTLNTGGSGVAYAFTSATTISQPCYQDFYGISILQAQTQYTFRCWAKVGTVSGTGDIVATLYSPTSGTLATANIPISSLLTTGTYQQANFSAKTPTVMPSDSVLQITTTGTGTVTVDEMEIIYTQNPYLNNVGRMSYVENPEAFDGVTGVIGPSDDPTAIVGVSFLRDDMYFHTQDRYHQTSDSPSNEPATWSVAEVSIHVGAISPWAIVPGQNWTVWASQGGAYMAEGSQPWKLSQEVQTLWNTINPTYQYNAWAVNDEINRRIYFGVPTGTAEACNQMFVLDYRELDSASQIAGSPPIHISFTGKMIASDLTRKWSPWNLALNCGNMLTRPNGSIALCVGGNFGNYYYLDVAKLTDDDYGQIYPYYTSYFFVNHEMEQALQMGCHRKLFYFLSEYVTGVGNINNLPFADSLTTPRTQKPPYMLSTSIDHDLEWGLNVNCERMAIQVFPTPFTAEQFAFNPGLSAQYLPTDVSFNLQKMVVALRANPWSPVRGRI